MALRLTFLLSLICLLATLHSSAQHHGHRHGRPNVQHASRLPDSVATSDDEIKPFTPDTPASSGDNTTTVPVVDSTQQVITANADTSTGSEEQQPLVLRHIPDSVIRRWKASHDFDYANDLSLWRRRDERGSSIWQFFDTKAFQYSIYILLGCILLYVLYKIISENNLLFFYRRPARLKETRVDEAELPEEDLDQLLRRAIEGKEYRMAVRYFYLKTLRHLDARELIRWHIQATDAEYVQQMDATPQGGRFRWLTSAYERVWYGKFALDEHQFSRLSQYFQDFYYAVDHPNA